MKCPKCGYISFDYNQVCPKCSKDISAEQARLNLPSFRPDTPFLMEALVGEGEESGLGLDSGTYVDIESDTAEFETDDMDFGDTDTADSGEVEFGDSLETDEETGSVVADEDLLSTFDFEELEAETSDAEVTFDTSVTDFDLESDEEGLGKTTGEITEEPEEKAEISLSEPGVQEDASLDDVDLTEGTEKAEVELEEGEEIPEVAVVPEGLVGQDVTADMEPPDSELQEAARATDLWKEDSEEVALDLDDLTVDETGELKVDTEEAASEKEDDLSLDLDDLDLELDLDDSEEKPS